MNELIIKLFFGGYLLILGIVDSVHKEISYGAIIGAAGVVLINILFIRSITIPSLLGGIAIGTLILGISYMTKGKIGKGDGILLVILGAFVGFMDMWILLLYALSISAIWSIGLLIIKKVNRNYRIPFIPFIFLGYVGSTINGGL